MIEIIAERILHQHLHRKEKEHAARRLAVSIAVRLLIPEVHPRDTVTTSTGAKDEAEEGVCQAVAGPVEDCHHDADGTDENTRVALGICHGAGIPDLPAGTISRIRTRVAASLVLERMTKSSGARITDHPLATPQVL